MKKKVSKDEVKETLIKEIQLLFKNKNISPPSKIGDSTNLFSSKTGLDSLDLAELIVVLEKEYGVDPFKEGGTPLRTLGDFVSYYTKHAKL